MLKLLRNVRRALKQWRALPVTERDQYKHRVDRIRSLVGELGGQRAVDYVSGTSDSPDDSSDGHDIEGRPRVDMIADLQAETSSLLAALATPAGALVTDSVPKSARIAAKLANKGLRRAGRRFGR